MPLLVGSLCRSQSWFGCSFRLLFAAGFVFLFLLLFVRQCCQLTRSLPHINILQRQGKLSDMMFNECSVQGLVLVSADNEFDYLA